MSDPTPRTAPPRVGRSGAGVPVVGAGERAAEAAPVVDDVARPDVVLCPGGPMLVRGRLVVEDDQGVRHTTHRPVSAICRCSRSATLPWCDGTHKVLPATLRP